MIKVVRTIVDEHGRLPWSAEGIPTCAKLGLSSFAAVQVMIALEEHFGIEFSDEIMGLHRFESIDAMVLLLDEAGVVKSH